MGNKDGAFCPESIKNILRNKGAHMWFEYRGFTIHRLDLYWYLVICPNGDRFYETSTIAARKTIDGVIASQCAE